ncbi:Tricarboxylate transporter family protein [Marinomonas agarivorans]|nr:Tricarboxylate transporter family protein [Marinomonas agarivorans]
MIDLTTILSGFSDAFTLTTLLYVMLGVVIGQFVGAIPGIGPVMAMAIAIPFSFVMSPLSAIGLLIGINKGGLVGGAIPAVLMNTPGTPDAAATALDGYPLSRQGKPLKSMKMALYSSVTGDVFADILLITVAAPLAIIALQMGPVEVLSLMVCAFSIIAGLIGKSVTKGIISALLGLLFATIGTDPQHFTPRFVFQWFELYEGLPLAPVAIGMLAMSEILRKLASHRGTSQAVISIPKKQPRKDKNISFKEYWSCGFTTIRGAFIGAAVGIVPGVGSTAAAFLSYSLTKRSSKKPNSFGKGNLHGIAATESANSAVTGASMIPLFTLGIPGSVSAALIISALMVQGFEPGPLLFENQGQLVYGIFGTMLIANVMNLGIGQLGLRLWSSIIKAPESFIYSSSILLCFVGVGLTTGGLYGVVIMLIFAVLGYFMMALGYSTIIFIIAFFLGPRFESSLGQTLILIDGNPANFIDYPVSIFFLVLALVSAWWLVKKPSNNAANSAHEHI